MSDLANRTGQPVANDGRTPWADPVYTEYVVEELTQAGGPGLTDGGVLS